ncbi:MAG: response regulator transcription factor [Candidatus Ancillula sp.]|jgi:DNA-binding response OmpR family regulator|nr:response regulator transcription factor [Candidatus Ancillula sp.]
MYGKKYSIAIVDDLQDLVDSWTYLISEEGYLCEGFTSSDAFLTKYNNDIIFKKSLDLLILDLKIDERSGEDILQYLQKDNRQPRIQVIIASTRNEEFVKTKLLDLGADDFVDKTVGIQELLARIKARVRNIEPIVKSSKNTENEIKFINGGIEIEGNKISLTPNESKILELLVSEPDKLFSRVEIESKVYNHYTRLNDTNVVAVAISRMKKKLAKADEKYKDIIKSVWGRGWKFSELED